MNADDIDKIISITYENNTLFGISELGILYRFTGSDQRGHWVRMALPPLVNQDQTPRAQLLKNTVHPLPSQPVQQINTDGEEEIPMHNVFAIESQPQTNLPPEPEFEPELTPEQPITRDIPPTPIFPDSPEYQNPQA
jgi:hypothetical protein